MRSELFRMRLDKKERRALKRQSKARGKQLGFEGESAYVRMLIKMDAIRLAEKKLDK